MAKKNTLLKSKERRTVQDVAAFLRQLADSLEQNEITLQRGDEEVRIDVPSRVTFKVKAKEKIKKRSTKRQLKLTLKWKEGDRAENFVQIG
jgi:amphi-Trp domain-containing protein